MSEQQIMIEAFVKLLIVCFGTVLLVTLTVRLFEELWDRRTK